MDTNILEFDYPKEVPSIIKVIGVGGGGGNAVSHMYHSDIKDVTYLLCNTDVQALTKSPIPNKLVLGEHITNGLGAGNKPEKARKAAEESVKEIERALSDGTKMVFITAGMGGGTGTGAAPIIAKIAKDMGILTIGIVTIPFLFEGESKIIQAIRGVDEMSRNVDALLVINNEKLKIIYPDFSLTNAFKKADDTLTIAAKSIAEIITISGVINLDFADVHTTMQNGGVAIMSTGYGEGEQRLGKALDDALNSPLLNNNNVRNAKNILINFYFSENANVRIEEMEDLANFMKDFNSDVNVIWGYAIDNNLENKIKMTVLATGFDVDSIPIVRECHEDKVALKQEEREKMRQRIQDLYGTSTLTPTNTIRKVSNQQSAILTLEEMDDEALITYLEEVPAFKRSLDDLLKFRNKQEKTDLPISSKSKDSEHNNDQKRRLISF